ncbi:MAG TPA: protealysin inhibitor emfourin [Actinomycetales bacterium]|nr:protealysin inhibitor emfourin [Actinomycetales bacterium]
MITSRTSSGSQEPGRTSARRGIVPPYLLEHLASTLEDDRAARVRESLLVDDRHRTGRAATRSLLPSATRAGAPRRDDGTSPLRSISDARHTQDLPGDVVRSEGDAPTGDAATDEAYDGLGATWSLYRDVYDRDSLDGKGLALDASVHYGEDYDNAFWDGSRMVFGDGDGRVFQRFTIAVDVIGHELTHGVTELTAGLVYQGQSGALNESISDVFGSLVKQRSLGQDAASADWLIGEGLFVPGIKGVALRSMKAPGTAYDDPAIGTDPQPATMAGYVDTTDDNGGVHVNSGIPNHAFYLAATAIGGDAWDGAGHVWYDVLTGGGLPSDADFATFAQATVDAARARFGTGSSQAQAVLGAWQQVGLLGTGGGPSSGSGSRTGSHHDGADAPAPVVVERSGGFTGLRTCRDIDLRTLPEDDAAQWRELLGSALLQGLAPQPAQPDRYVYRVCWAPAGIDVTAAEHQLPGYVRELFERTLHQP